MSPHPGQDPDRSNANDVGPDDPTLPSHDPPSAPAAHTIHMDFALDYARRGIPVFPCFTPARDVNGRPCCGCWRPTCKSPAKHPATRHGVKDATTDLSVIERWFGPGGKHEGANLGAAMGGPLRLVAVDVDPRHGGDASLARIEAEHGALPATATQDTQSGGWHLIFRVPDPTKIRNRSDGSIAPGIDVRSDGGYVLVAPSEGITWRRYAWRAGLGLDAVVDAPEWLVAMLEGGGAVPRSENEGASHGGNPHGDAAATIPADVDAAKERASSQPTHAPSSSRPPVDSLASRISRACASDPERVARFFSEHGIAGLAKQGDDGWWKGSAPWTDQGKDPSFGVHPETGSWKAHREGGATGGLIEFLVRERHVSEIDAAKEVCKSLGIEWHGESPAKETARSKAEQLLEFGISRPEETFDNELLDACADLDAASAGRVRAILDDRFGRDFKRRDFDRAVAEKRRVKDVTRQDRYAASEGAINYPDLGVSGLKMPDGYEIDENGRIWRRRTQPTREGERVVRQEVSPSPVFVVGCQRDLATNANTLTVRWRKGTKWFSSTVPRRTAVDGRKILDLADAGLNVCSESAGALSSFLLAFDVENYVVIQKRQTYTSSRCAWLMDEDGLIGFMWGRTLIKAPPRDGNERPDVVFHGADVGDDQLASALHSRGKLDTNISGLVGLEAYPRVLVGLLSSLVPPLMPSLKIPNFGIDWCGRSSCGKTTALMVLAHAWGNPDPNGGGYVSSWNTTRVAFERTLHVLGCLPIPIDETKRGGKPEEMAQIVYDGMNGCTRKRGSITGLQRTGGANVVIASTGESPLTQVTHDEGTKARILSLWGSPFGEKCQQTTKFVASVRSHVRACYGTIGPAFVRWVLDHLDEADQWRADLASIHEARVRESANDHVLGRLAEYVAAIEFTAQLAHRAIPFPWSVEDSLAAVEEAWKAAVKGAEDADVPREAFAHVCGECARREQDFRGRRSTSDQPNQGWAGRWDIEPWDRILVSVNVVHEWLTRAGFDRSVVRSWSEEGWLAVGAGGKSSTVARLGGNPERVYAITREAFESCARMGERERE